MKKIEPKKAALALCLNMTDPEIELIQKDISQDNVYTVGKSEYLVLTEEEANDKAREEIERSLWAFNPDFILTHNENCSSMGNWEYDTAIEALKEAQGKSCENLNGLVRCLISNMDEFVEDAIMADGRGHFIAFYDGREEEQRVAGVDYYIYQIN